MLTITQSVSQSPASLLERLVTLKMHLNFVLQNMKKKKIGSGFFNFLLSFLQIFSLLMLAEYKVPSLAYESLFNLISYKQEFLNN